MRETRPGITGAGFCYADMGHRLNDRGGGISIFPSMMKPGRRKQCRLMTGDLALFPRVRRTFRLKLSPAVIWSL
jgi:hypothetical protein